jgi:hypothetical protein
MVEQSARAKLGLALTECLRAYPGGLGFRQSRSVQLARIGRVAGTAPGHYGQCVSTFGRVGFSIVTWSCL